MVRRTSGWRATWRAVSEDFWVDIRGFCGGFPAMAVGDASGKYISIVARGWCAEGV